MLELIQIPELIEGVLQVIGGGAVIATITPTKWDNVILSILSKIIHVTAMNVGAAKNAK